MSTPIQSDIRSLRERFSDYLVEGNRLAYVGGGMAVVAAGLFVVGAVMVSRQEFRLLPDRSATPGAILAVTAADLCPTSSAAGAIPTKVGREVFDRYGIERPKSGVYEMDLLIPHALGGADEPSNYWPQPFGAGEWNAHIKDALEDRLHQLVCENKLSLKEAQQAIAWDWVAAYKKYFQTSGPLTIHRNFQKDPPWNP